ncbi:Cobyric acid synthase [Methanimicrococcus sp. At1]|uniref:Probable cobyric acid synthase n=1 Tax=Methanimicrococcus hacksteinii TaxID=3028293 RepID=A0ABU3VRD3_9EURY|nr:cobyric acid synthase [Methanimicrococcus sp. At1]MDV0445880.1 Cobyric acid synthase [Methanimicrococcus sp. At1]
MDTKRLLIFGTSSDAGKSSIVTAICKIMSRDYKTAPFKAQNMSLNSWVNPDGKEISYAQVIQAWAAGADPIPEMNPVVLKPKGDSFSQVVVLGEHYADRSAGNYYESIDEMSEILSGALSRLDEKYDVVIMEGAGGAAEINLYDRDIVNVGTARITDAPILIVGDIERGGVFASLYGTFMLLPEDIKKNIKGFIINKFRGDPEILRPGLKQLEEMTGIPVLGIMPYFRLRIPSEDSMSFREKEGAGTVPDEKKNSNTALEIAVIQFPKISHFNDYEILETQARVRYIDIYDSLGNPDLIILPGSGTPLKDLAALRESGMADQILSKAGTVPIIGIGEGYQMLGQKLTGPDGKSVDGFGLLDIETVYEKEEGYSEKPVRVSLKVNGCTPYLKAIEGETIEGFNAYSGSISSNEPIFGSDGACSKDGTVIGTSMHGFFDNKNLRVALLKYLAEKKGVPYAEEDGFTMQDGFEELAKVFEENIDVEFIYKIMGLK